MDQVCTYKACPRLINNEPSTQVLAMTSPTIDIRRSSLFNETLKGQHPSHPSHNASSHDTRKPNEVLVNHPNIIEELYGTSRKPRSFKQWEDAARENTQQIKAHGSPSPLVWVKDDCCCLRYFAESRSQVLVKGKDIPSNAIVGGEERRQPLYIARTFYEVGFSFVTMLSGNLTFR